MSSDPINRSKEYMMTLPRMTRLAIIGGVVVLVIAVVLAVAVASRPAFLGNYDSYKNSYTSLGDSVHSELACNECHVDERASLVQGTAKVVDFYRGLAGRPDKPVMMQLPTPTKEACKRCHLWDWSDDSSRTARVPHKAHLRVKYEERECVKCHKWTAHEEEYIAKHQKMPFSSVCASMGCHVGFKAKDECQACHHSLQKDKGEWKRIHKLTVRASGANRCLERCHRADQCRECHTTGVKPKDIAQVGAYRTDVSEIEAGHVKSDWIDKHGSIAIKDDTKCFVCHYTSGQCEDCHSKRPAFHGLKSTWIGRHKKLAKPDKTRCLACHDWDNFCQKCHAKFKEMQ